MNLQALDYEELKTLNLEVAVSNKAAYNFGSRIPSGPIIQKPYPIKINVLNEKEGPRFQPSVKVVTLSEDHTSVSLHKVIANYAAIDSDTLQTATNVRYSHIVQDVTKHQMSRYLSLCLWNYVSWFVFVTSHVFYIYRYAKIKDDDNWLIIDEKTADIRLKKLPDRESKYLINGTYYAKIICISNGEFCKYDSCHFSPVDRYGA